MFYSHSFCATNIVDFINDMDGLVNGGVEDIHLDFMDYKYTRSFGLNKPAVKHLLERYPNVSFNAHMMVMQPEVLAEDLLQLGVDKLAFHINTINIETFKEFKNKFPQAKMGVGIESQDQISNIKDYLEICDFVILMTIDKIGGTGQSLNPELLAKAKEIREFKSSIEIISDGGLRKENAHLFKQAGCDKAVGGSIINNVDDKTKFNEWFKEVINV